MACNVSNLVENCLFVLSLLKMLRARVNDFLDVIVMLQVVLLDYMLLAGYSRQSEKNDNTTRLKPSQLHSQQMHVSSQRSVHSAAGSSKTPRLHGQTAALLGRLPRM